MILQIKEVGTSKATVWGNSYANEFVNLSHKIKQWYEQKEKTKQNTHTHKYFPILLTRSSFNILNILWCPPMSSCFSHTKFYFLNGKTVPSYLLF